MLEESMNIMLEENFGTSNVMDVSELRRLYYGRLDMFLTFSNNDSIKMNSNPKTPLGYLAYNMFDVIGRKVKDSSFYAHVYRFNTRKNVISNIKTYNTTDLSDDLNKLRTYTNVPETKITEIIDNLNGTSLLRNSFQRLYSVTYQIALTENKSNVNEVWKNIFMYLGYDGIIDQHGTGLLSNTKQPCALIFIDPTVIDIVPIQKGRKDERNRVINNVDRKVSQLSTKRNKIAKRNFKNRKVTNRKGMFLSVLMGALNDLSV